MPGSARKITDTQLANLRARRAQGETLQALGRRFSYTREGVRLLLKGSGGDPKPAKIELLIGKTFHRFTIIGEAAQAENGDRRALCRCQCGNEKIVRVPALKQGEAKSCGCLQKDSHTDKLARWLTYQGRTKPLQCWCRELGLKRITVSRRLNTGWSVEEALGTPIYGRYGGVDENGERTRNVQRNLNQWSAVGAMAELLMGFNCRQVAERRGVSRGTIECVWYGKTWQELFEEETSTTDGQGDANG